MNPLKIIVLLMGWPFYRGGVVEETSLTERLYFYFYNDVGHYANRMNQAGFYHLLYAVCTVVGWIAFLGMLYLYHTGVVVMNMPHYMDTAIAYIVAAIIGRLVSFYLTPELISMVMAFKFAFRNMLYTYRNKKQS